jgi:RNA polymerase sigma-70 factor (ECF subfamily)
MKMVNSLTDTTKEVFVKFAIEGYSHQEISGQLGIAEGTSKWHLNKARNALAKLIEKFNQTKNLDSQTLKMKHS